MYLVLSRGVGGSSKKSATNGDGGDRSGGITNEAILVERPGVRGRSPEKYHPSSVFVCAPTPCRYAVTEVMGPATLQPACRRDDWVQPERLGVKIREYACMGRGLKGNISGGGFL